MAFAWLINHYDMGQQGGWLSKVKRGIVKPALKKEITTERVKSLYKELGTQQKVADYLGVDIKTVRKRLKE